MTLTLKVLLVDDEALARSRLKTLLGDCTDPLAIVNGEARTVTVPLPSMTTFWRLRSATALRITGVEVQGNTVVLSYAE